MQEHQQRSDLKILAAIAEMISETAEHIMERPILGFSSNSQGFLGAELCESVAEPT